MFVQVLQGRVSDPAELREALDSWQRELAPGSDGWLGTTAGVTADGEFIALVRFDSAEAAERNSHRPEQHQWWMETAKLFAGDVTFHDCQRVDTFLAGGSDEAGFVQVMQGRSPDPQRLWELNRSSEARLQQYRPDIIGGTVAMPARDDETITEAVYFTSEPAAREGERKPPPPELAELFETERELFADVRYYDLTEPWLYSRQS